MSDSHRANDEPHDRYVTDETRSKRRPVCPGGLQGTQDGPSDGGGPER